MDAASVSIEVARVWRGASARAARVVLEAVSLEIEAGECVALAGPNGAGKTSLLFALVGATPFEGRISIGGMELTRRALPTVRQRVGFVFADPTDQLFLPTVAEEVAFGPTQRGRAPREVEQAATEALASVGLSGFESRRPAELSLGEQRRLTVATALSCRPGLLLIDEPTAGLDPRARRAMIETISDLDATVVLATHDLDAALDLGARVVLLQSGRMLQTGPAAELLTDAALLDAAGLALPLSIAPR